MQNSVKETRARLKMLVSKSKTDGFILNNLFCEKIIRQNFDREICLVLVCFIKFTFTMHSPLILVDFKQSSKKKFVPGKEHSVS